MKSSRPEFRSPRLLVVGAGFLGATVARQAFAGGWSVVPVVRSEKSAQGLALEFPGVLAAQATEEPFWETLKGDWDGLVWSLSPSVGQESEFHYLHRDGARLAARWAQAQKVAMVYVSSTSIYAEASGNWVKEESPLAIQDERSMALAEAEKLTLSVGGTVLRCAGIYGPGRELRRSQEGPERWLNIVQVEDAARAVGKVLGRKREIYNACEDEPIRRGVPGGQWPVGRRVRRNKRVSNAKLRGLGWQPLWKAEERRLA